MAGNRGEEQEGGEDKGEGEKARTTPLFHYAGAQTNLTFKPGVRRIHQLTPNFQVENTWKDHLHRNQRRSQDKERPTAASHEITDQKP